MTKKLYRSQTDKIIAGVCGGLAGYFNIDPTIVRLIFAFIIIAPMGSGFLIYLVLWLVIPKNPNEPAIINQKNIKEFVDEVKGRASGLKEEFKKNDNPEEKSEVRSTEDGEIKKRRGNLLGWFLIILGAIFLVNTIFPVIFHFSLSRYWPGILLLLVGVILVFRTTKN